MFDVFVEVADTIADQPAMDHGTLLLRYGALWKL